MDLMLHFPSCLKMFDVRFMGLYKIYNKISERKRRRSL